MLAIWHVTSMISSPTFVSSTDKCRRLKAKLLSRNWKQLAGIRLMFGVNFLIFCLSSRWHMMNFITFCLPILYTPSHEIVYALKLWFTFPFFQQSYFLKYKQQLIIYWNYYASGCGNKKVILVCKYSSSSFCHYLLNEKSIQLYKMF